MMLRAALTYLAGGVFETPGLVYGLVLYLSIVGSLSLSAVATSDAKWL